MQLTTRNHAGFSLIEILVTLLILTVGLLGLVGMQVMAHNAELESYQRAQAMVLMSDIVDRLNTNRKAATCYAVTGAGGTPYLGTAGSDKYNLGAYSCPSLATNPTAVARAGFDLQVIDQMVLGAAERNSDGLSIGTMLGARACIGFDNASQGYTVAVAWQGMSKTFSPDAWPTASNPAVARKCALNLYGDDTQRRVIWTTVLIASLT
jgi:type IV pilus assembly protein PilV